MSSVVFDVGEFRGQFTQFSDEDKISDATLDMYFDLSVDRYGNDDTSIFPYDPDKNILTRKRALYFYVCHLATLELWSLNGQTGKITSASQGSVSSSFDVLKSNKPSIDWFLQTPCGSIFYMQFLKPLIVGGRAYNFKKYHPWN